MRAQGWSTPTQELIGLVNDYHAKCVQVYRQDVNRVQEDAGKERGIAEGGYGRKQIQELVQNAADALRGTRGRVQVTLTDDALYVANQGESFEGTGVRALLYTHLSNKTGDEIGRFGLGFKSISGISDGPQIFSQTVSFEFSRHRTATELSHELGQDFDDADVPALRLSWVIEPTLEIRSDPLLAEMTNWAVTVVKVPLKPGAAEHLSEEIAEFDESFSLFAPHVRQLDLRDIVAGQERSFSATKKGNRVTLTTEDGARDWLVISREHRPSDAALASAGYAARRDAVTVSWAVPTTGKLGLGQLSAFFPVKSDLSLSGRVNAPWKLSDDRINVIECEFNREILADVLPKLVVDARRELVADGSYGRYIDVLPARGREIRSWSDGVLNEPVYEALRDARCLPDLDGQLRSANSVRRAPSEIVGNFTEHWLSITGARGDWVHPECTANRERIAKVDRLMQDNPHRVGRIVSWIEAVVADPTAKQSAAAIELAAEIEALGGNAPKDVRDSQIVLLENGKLQQPVRGRCFIRTDSDQGGAVFIDGDVTRSPSTLAALEHLGITSFEDGGEMSQLISTLARDGVVDWDALWIAMRGSGEASVLDSFNRILHGHADKIVRVKNGNSDWVLPSDMYLAGDYLKQIKEDSSHLADNAYHAADAEILALLGVRSRPTRDGTRAREKWLGRYLTELKEHVGDQMKLGIQARENIHVDNIDTVLRPLQCLPQLSPTNRAALTVSILKELRDSYVRVTHPSVNKAARYIAPELWWIKNQGMLPTNLGLVHVSKAFTPSSEAGEFQGLLPTAGVPELSDEVVRLLRLRTDIATLSSEDFQWLIDAHKDRDDVVSVGRIYGWWCHTHTDNAPDTIWVRQRGTWAPVETGQVAVAPNTEAQRDLEEFGIPCVLLDTAEDCYNLREFWGCLEGRELPLTYSYETSAEPAPLLDMFDIFDELDLDDDPDDLSIQKCLSISKVAAVPGRPEVRVGCQCGREGNIVLVTGENERDILQQVLACLELDDSREQVDAHLDARQRKRDTKLMRQIRGAADDGERLLLFAGEDRLKALIPKDALDYLSSTAGTSISGSELTRLCITMLGTRALERVCKVEAGGLPVTPPSTWHGSFQTRKWVRDLGFGDEWAGQKTGRRNKPTEYIEGPTKLNKLHDYQEAVSNRLLGMLIGDGPNRGIVSLPTGAGKTRVAVQTIIYAIRGGAMGESTTGFSGPILWLADGEELCEQAIDAWSYLWRAEGQQDTQLVLSRFWSNYETEEESGGVQVVVATWQKILKRAVGEPDFAWLADSPLVVIDEAHGALHKSYTQILEWTGRGTHQRDKPLLGLTATPFRGRKGSEETLRLLRRFDDNLLDEGVFGDDIPQVRLQRDRVLARARLEILHGVSIELSDQELEEFRKKYWMPKNAEKRLGQREDRTRTILDSILSKPDDWPIVVFAASVENAQTLATLLTLQGRPAASIDTDTSPDDRRSAVQRFKDGELRVLTNYAVLSQGFDAPLTRAVYITRPTSSEVRYQQMIGRGLRGPRNGGSEEVLIVNVLDNIVEFGDSIVYDSLTEILEIEEPEVGAH
ncbi:DEAD/DEAH box helicase family protein [Rhodococcus sp. BP-349]|uniref:DEAD/DEAH box helicase n=1 Tax=unclassified Rhodococcus (in: high G+C Gram-positive bacteria) TaxID=192944 RepID=UPI001C9B1CEE|nr:MULTISPECIES: DEAD/DEAH box helicase family protein [unclassified Rhodococcus (in: high G+C Gram-positive bacteria)]MBY6540053.1 DEAD/DEAH box helicase family protein [Rhodococcus sp. BP-363]MBY6543619.1 DEAD/DEAH box helicase family protein [Rhodococcus sp. BP-369]MBY6562849.1 DEAD/DEAH box helicase family protein [Rhodococcus sp. BP-370]MBY6577141.1 DEAD/DEAH box helicase family protein [Rhodococcus sp. BP-364]MBY6586442.1 DEAD/DEAH box helicase family protein [Rhodococcus sp. BP-358]